MDTWKGLKMVNEDEVVAEDWDDAKTTRTERIEEEKEKLKQAEEERLAAEEEAKAAAEEEARLAAEAAAEAKEGEEKADDDE